MLPFITATLGFLGGLLSFFAALRLHQSSLSQRVKVWRIGKELAGAYRNQDKETIARFELLLQEAKLYLTNVVHQTTAIAYFEELKNGLAFEVIAERLGRNPQLPQEVRRSLILALKRLAPFLDEHS